MKKHMENMHFKIVNNYFLSNVQFNNTVEVDEYMDENLVSVERPIKKTKSKHKCHDCDKVFLSSKVLLSHRKKNHPELNKNLNRISIYPAH